MAKSTSKTSFFTKEALPNAVLLRRAKAGTSDLEAFLSTQDAVRCRDSRELAIATDTLILEGTITRAVRQMDSLLRRARKAGIEVPLRRPVAA
jgi:hypothetical protein